MISPRSVVLAILYASFACLWPSAAHAADSWTQLASLHIGRYTHATVRLADGRVLVVGGLPTSTEVYDPATDIWTTTASINITRLEPNAVLLEDGRVLVFGGSPGNASTDDVEIYDPASDAWSSAASSFVLYGARAVRLPDGRVLAAGGQGFSSDPVAFQSVQSGAQLYDPVANSWTSVAPMNLPRERFALVLMQDGRALAIGGTNAVTDLTAEAYDPVSNTWTPVSPLSVPVGKRVAAATLPDGRVVVAGGTRTAALIYDPVLDKWTTLGPLLPATEYEYVLPLTDGGALLLSTVINTTTGFTSATQRMDPVSLALAATDPMPIQVVQRGQNDGVVLSDGAILLTGGLQRDPGATANVISSGVQRYGAPQPGYTTTGAGIVAQPVDSVTGTQPVTIAFSTVTSPGLTTETSSSSGPIAPPDFQVGNPAVYYDVTTTATYSGTITVCINYTGVTFPGAPAIFHFEAGSWVDRTSSTDPTNRIVCGVVTSLSPFALFAHVVPTNPTIIWANPADISEGTPLGATQLNATASIGGAPVAGTFTYSPQAGTMLNAGPAQTLSVTFQPSGGGSTIGAQATINVTPTSGRMEGAGSTDAGGLRYEFDFHVQERGSGAERGALRLEVERIGRETRANQIGIFMSTAITPLVFSNNPSIQPGRWQQPAVDTATFGGVGIWKGAPGYTFTAEAADAGEPGRGQDRFAITIRDPNGVVVANVDGTIRMGNIESSRMTR